MKCVFALLAVTVPVFAGSPGIRPRVDAAAYPVNGSEADFSLGAWIVPPDQVKKMFKLDLNHAGYVVIEVGVFPSSGKHFDLSPNDFTLYIGDKQASIRPISSDTIADVMFGRPDASPSGTSLPGDVNTSVGASIGRVSYPDPVTGRRTSGTVTDTEVGVGVSGPAPTHCRQYDCTQDYPAPPVQPSSTQKANVVAQDLWEKSLPEGKTAHAVAGYLYFPKPSHKAKSQVWQLQFDNENGRAQLTLR